MTAMRPEHVQGIKQILGQMKCPLDFRCTKDGCEHVCMAKDVGLDHLLECLETDPPDCGFSLQSNSAVLCECPLRVYLTKTVGL